MSGIDRVCGLPGPWQQFVEPIYWMSVDHARENITQIGIWLDVVQLRSLCRPPNYAEWFERLSVKSVHL